MGATYKPKLYLETTIFNFYNNGKAMSKQQNTRAVHARNRKERERMGSDAYDALKDRQMMEAMEAYCRAHPGVQIVQHESGGYMFKNVGTTQS